MTTKKARLRLRRPGPLSGVSRLSPLHLVLIGLGGWVALFLLYIFLADPQDRSVDKFLQNWRAYLALYWPLTMLFLSRLHARGAADDEHERVIRGQKDRIKLLNAFGPQPSRTEFWPIRGSRSIYTSVLDMVDRAHLSADSHKDERYTVQLLLCSPTLDYTHESRSDYASWGDEFDGKLNGLMGNENVRIEITCLSDESIQGHQPLHDFLSVLAAYCHDVSRSPLTHRQILTKIREAALNRLTNLQAAATDRGHITIKKMLNIPFQIFLVTSKHYSEVIVSFAGREILEDANPPEPRGFLSCDPDVVEAFAQVYADYTTDHRRRPTVPPHTEDMIADQSRARTPYRVHDFLNLGFDIVVQPNVFSPAFGNSSKFTAWVISKILTPDDKSVLDIGSGTGVLALTAWHTLTRPHPRKGRSDLKVVAVEGMTDAFGNLRRNCGTTGVIPLNCCLVACTSSGLQLLADRASVTDPIVGANIVDSTALDEEGHAHPGATSAFNDNFGNHGFDLVIADLPYVDAEPKCDLDRAYFDTAHREHQALFTGIAGGKWLRPGGRLVTSFSTLGGPEDVARFERMIADRAPGAPRLKVTQKFSFCESGYVWMVYVIMKENAFDQTRYWWEALHARESSPE